MAPSEKVETVEKLALAGWEPSILAKFVCSIEEIEESERKNGSTNKRWGVGTVVKQFSSFPGQGQGQGQGMSSNTANNKRGTVPGVGYTVPVQKTPTHSYLQDFERKP